MKNVSSGFIGLLSFVSVSAFASSGHPLIVGGTQVGNISQVPFLVQLHDDNGVECGGTVIDKSWVLSAAHCEDVVSSITLLGGSITSGDGTPLAIKNHFVHPKFQQTDTTVSYDYMLIQLAQPIDFTKSAIQPIALPDAAVLGRGIENAGTMVTVAGWGDLSENGGNYPSIMNEVQVPIVDQATANADYGGTLDNTMIAAGYPQGGKDSCDGDSGGPLYLFDSVSNKNVLVGSVSFGQGCAESGYPGIYARVSAGMDWITQTMQANP